MYMCTFVKIDGKRVQGSGFRVQEKEKEEKCGEK
jgi:hypothetical protein